jgi:transposase-like protein
MMSATTAQTTIPDVSEPRRRKVPSPTPPVIVVDDDWSPRWKELETFQKNYGHCRVPGVFSESSDTYPLACWVGRQRQQYKLLREGKKGCINITEERIQKLQDIGFEWFLPQCTPWDERFEELKAFQKEHGHCRVINNRQDKDSSDTHQLYHWVRNQRVQFKLLQQGKKSLSREERIQKLNDIGFVWTFTHDWDERFEELKVFQNEMGHCRVPQAKGTDTYQLASWVKQQRKEYKTFTEGKKSLLTQERIEKLNGIGFALFVRTRIEWDERLEALKAYQHEHGHCRVPRTIEIQPRNLSTSHLGNQSTTEIYVHAARQEIAACRRKNSKVG